MLWFDVHWIWLLFTICTNRSHLSCLDYYSNPLIGFLPSSASVYSPPSSRVNLLKCTSGHIASGSGGFLSFRVKTNPYCALHVCIVWNLASCSLTLAIALSHAASLLAVPWEQVCIYLKSLPTCFSSQNVPPPPPPPLRFTWLVDLRGYVVQVTAQNKFIPNHLVQNSSFPFPLYPFTLFYSFYLAV